MELYRKDYVGFRQIGNKQTSDSIGMIKDAHGTSSAIFMAAFGHENEQLQGVFFPQASLIKKLTEVSELTAQ